MSEVQHGDTWETRDGRAVVVASNRWPAPAPGGRYVRTARNGEWVFVRANEETE